MCDCLTMQDKNMLRIAIPNKGSLSEGAVKIFSDAGYSCRRQSRELKVIDYENNVEFIFLRPTDISVYVENGVLDLGVTGRDLVVESGSEVDEILSLGYGKSMFHYAVPEESLLTVDDFNGKKIATSYPVLVKKDLKDRSIEATVIKLDGAIEISINLGVADAIADVVQTGRTMVEAGLKIIGGPVMNSEAVLIGRVDEPDTRKDICTIVNRINGIVVAREYVMIEYDVSDENIEEACMITPGIEAPTVSPLNRNGWYAVKAMARKKGMNQLVDDLNDLGCKGIVVSDIRTCRI